MFQRRFPVLQAVYQAEYPQDCQPRLDWINWPESPAISGPRSFTVQLANIPAIKDEPLKPSDEAIAGRLLVRFSTEKAPKYGRFFSDWKDMGLWYEQLSQERRQPDEKVRVKAGELISGLTDLRAQIEKLAAFVQQEIRYVSIQIGIGGYQPHPAPEILANRYGDCKDKATLLAALLSYLFVDA
ncbi:MAG: transglutaminase-like domain-containing protein [Candidatus Saccharicenans sp.]|uniref:transglutaminase-like domain-containing protein n=1 Tax=Candidatus Saccharicenans sp. TaxID=2819258 RepID=UPI00404997AC